MKYVALFSVVLAACTARVPRDVPDAAPSFDARAILDEAAQRYSDVAAARNPSDGYPRATNAQGKWHQTPRNEWTSGFFPGTLWLVDSREQGERWTWPLALIPRGNYSHDLGFQYNSSFVNAYRATGDERYRTEALNGARLLAARFNPTVGAIKSWDWMPANRPFPVIVDNMMNLELLFWGARQPGGDPNWRRIAIQHARTTIANHLRPDGGSYHVVVFDPADGKVLERITHQGHADNTTWARGQAWLIYGFTMTYRETGEPEFLATAQRVADYFIKHLPADGIPCWDFQAPNCVRDASAAAIAASGLFELSRYSGRYRDIAQRIIGSLSSPAYRTTASESEALIKHAVGNMPAGTEIDVGISYGDYYYVEAVRRSQGSVPAFTPRTIIARGELLREARERSAQLNAAIDELKRAADSVLTLPPFTVTSKTRIPPSGDKRDYMSFGPYWWPDTTKPNGLPYIRRDGEVNWDLRRQSDALRLYAFTDAVETLALAYYFTGDNRYAAAAATQLRSWFINPETRMNPHLKYGQAIPGVSEGRGIGIIDTRDLGRITDAIALMPNALRQTEADQIKAWMREYLAWLRTSEHGIDESDEANNHGTWYDVQIAQLALYTGDTTLARNVLGESVPKRIAAQIDSTGKQPLEYARTRSLHYSVENLDAMTRLAELARHVGVDLWPSLRKAIDFVAPYADTTRKWPGQQITAERKDLFFSVLAKAQNAYGESRYTNVVRRMDEWKTHRVNLFYPAVPRATADSLLHAARLAALPPAERAQWQQYITLSNANAAHDRGGRTEWTPAPIGQGFFVTKEMTPEWFKTQEAAKLGIILMSYQTPTGGWSKRINFTHTRAANESYSSENNWTWIGTLDNGATTEQLKFLIALNAAQPHEIYQNSITRGAGYLLAAQMPNGCFPQIYPLQGSYHDAITYNDDATINALTVLERLNFPSARAAVQRGIECILRTQVRINGVKTVWAAQHDPITWQPIKARAYEHASLSGRESGAILDFLMRISTPGDSVKSAIHAAAKWFNDNAIRGYSYVPRGDLTADPNAGPLWARFYELGTNRPIFSDRDGIVRYRLSEVGEERRRGYLWYTDEPIATLRRYERWKQNN